VKVFAPAFYALDQARVPVVGSVCGMISNLVLNLALYPVLGYRGVALGTSLAATVNFAVLGVAWKRRHGGLGDSGVVRQLGRVIVASAVLGVVAWASHRAVSTLVPHPGVPGQLARALVPIAVAGAAYVVTARRLRIEELDELLGALRRRARARSSGG
jgi:putative peptidoglycan lipid II flippase